MKQLCFYMLALVLVQCSPSEEELNGHLLKICGEQYPGLPDFISLDGEIQVRGDTIYYGKSPWADIVGSHQRLDGSYKVKIRILDSGVVGEYCVK